MIDSHELHFGRIFKRLLKAHELMSKSIRKALPVIFLVFISGLVLHAQKALQYEKGGSLKTRKFYIGDEIQFKIDSENDIWYSRIIYDIDLESNSILIENLSDENPVQLPISDITHFRIGKRNKVGKLLGQVLLVGGINTILTTWALARRDIVPSWREDPVPLISGGLGMLVGYVVWKIFSREEVKLNRRKRLRLIDTTLYFPSS